MCITVAPFDWPHWLALWTLRRRQLAEHGIILPIDEIPAHPRNVDRGGYDWDYYHMADVYLNRAGVIELWTGSAGPGRRLYEKLGFCETAGPGAEFSAVAALTGYVPSDDEIRMRLDLTNWTKEK